MNYQRLTVLCSFFSLFVFGQYTDQINSNRPGASIGAYAVGKGVIQFEAGGEYRTYDHKGYNNSKVNAEIGFFTLRYGLLREQLELTFETAYQMDRIKNRLTFPSIDYKREGFITNFFGVKYLLYDPFKKERETNVYSWKANNGFKLRNLLPAVSITLGANLVLNPNFPYAYGDVFNSLHKPVFYGNLGRDPERESIVSGRATIATQSHFFETWVLVTNFTYNRIISAFPDFNYILTLTHTVNPLWSVYIETQGHNSDIYIDQIFRLGGAYLYSDDIQIEATLGANAKDTPSLFFVNLGVSYRLDFHQDIDPEKIEEQRLLRKEEKRLNKGAKKAEKANKKRNRKAKRN
ncbi:MAG: transporter [Flavobacteriaceae bacterium]